jgi:hypothetical protein
LLHQIIGVDDLGARDVETVPSFFFRGRIRHVRHRSKARG